MQTCVIIPKIIPCLWPYRRRKATWGSTLPSRWLQVSPNLWSTRNSSQTLGSDTGKQLQDAFLLWFPKDWNRTNLPHFIFSILRSLKKPRFAALEKECLTWKMALLLKRSLPCLKIRRELWVCRFLDNRRWPGSRFQRAFPSLVKKVPEEILGFKKQLNETVAQDQVCQPEQKCPTSTARGH